MKFLQLDPRPEARADMLNLLNATPTLGVEVTIPELAAACKLGNIDPQHQERQSYHAAIDEVHAYDIQDAVQVVTIRPDLDSIGCMAMLRFRERGAGYSISDEPEDLRGVDLRVRRISAYDRFVCGPWSPGQHVTVDPEMRGLAALASDNTISLEDRIWAIMCWIAHGTDASKIVTRYVVAAETADADARGRTRVEARGGIAVVTSDVLSRLPIDIGYEAAPIVLFFNPAIGKYSVAVWPGSGALDLPAALAHLQAIEPEWGGNAAGGIIGSPQGRASRLSTEDVYGVVARYVA